MAFELILKSYKYNRNWSILLSVFSSRWSSWNYYGSI